MKYAFYDFDNTLAKGDSILPFMLFCLKRKLYSPFHLIRTGFHFVKNKLLHKDFRQTKEVSLSFLKGKSKEEITELCNLFWETDLKNRLFPKAIAKIKELHEQNYTIVVVSASTSCYMDLITDRLPVDLVISTGMAYDKDSRFTGTVEANCKGEEKVRRIMEFLHGDRMSLLDSLAFGDSSSDLPMLGLAGQGFLVSPSRKLQKQHPEYPVMNWKE